MEYETIKHINLSTFTVDGITYTISRPERIVCTDGRTEPLPILDWQAVDADGGFAGNQSIWMGPEPLVDLSEEYRPQRCIVRHEYNLANSNEYWVELGAAL